MRTTAPLAFKDHIIHIIHESHEPTSLKAHLEAHSVREPEFASSQVMAGPIALSICHSDWMLNCTRTSTEPLHLSEPHDSLSRSVLKVRPAWDLGLAFLEPPLGALLNCSKVEEGGGGGLTGWRVSPRIHVLSIRQSERTERSA
jgi:hypothetical protein